MTRKEYPVTDQINVCDKGSVTEGILLSVVKKYSSINFSSSLVPDTFVFWLIDWLSDFGFKERFLIIKALVKLSWKNPLMLSYIFQLHLITDFVRLYMDLCEISYLRNLHVAMAVSAICVWTCGLVCVLQVFSCSKATTRVCQSLLLCKCATSSQTWHHNKRQEPKTMSTTEPKPVYHL